MANAKEGTVNQHVGVALRRRSGSEEEYLEIESALADAARAIDAALDVLLPMPAAKFGRVQDAMRYAIFSGGKRLRAFLALQCASLFHVPERAAMRTAGAVEVLHCYSLIHDDLPCMDDDNLRRGRATVHRRFDDATALLAGDGLLTLAFEILSSEETHPLAKVRCELIRRLAEAAGSNGMVGGQMMDMLAPESSFDPADVVLLQSLKTAALIEVSCEMGAILGEASSSERNGLREFGRNLGVAFQMVDDLIDVLGDAQQAGKAVGKDKGKGKATLVSLLGIEKARREAALCMEAAEETLHTAGIDNPLLCALPDYLMSRIS